MLTEVHVQKTKPVSGMVSFIKNKRKSLSTGKKYALCLLVVVFRPLAPTNKITGKNKAIVYIVIFQSYTILKNIFVKYKIVFLTLATHKHMLWKTTKKWIKIYHYHVRFKTHINTSHNDNVLSVKRIPEPQNSRAPLGFKETKIDFLNIV